MAQDDIIKFLACNYNRWYCSREIADALEINVAVVSKDCLKLYAKWGLIDRKLDPLRKGSAITYAYRFRGR